MGADSLSLAELAMTLEDKFEMMLTPEQEDSLTVSQLFYGKPFATVDDAIKMVMARC